MATYSLKLSTEIVVKLLQMEKVACTLSDGIIADPYDIPFSHNIVRLTYQSPL